MHHRHRRARRPGQFQPPSPRWARPGWPSTTSSCSTAWRTLAARRQRLLRLRQPRQGDRDRGHRGHPWSRSGSTSPGLGAWRACGSVSGPPTPPPSTRRWPRPRTPTWRWCSSAPTNHEWETGAATCTSFAPPRGQDDLVRRCCGQPRTAVVVNAALSGGPAVVDDVAATLQCWFGGQIRLSGGRRRAHRHSSRRAPPDDVPLSGRALAVARQLPRRERPRPLRRGRVHGLRASEHRAITPRFLFGHGPRLHDLRPREPTLSSSTFEPGDTLTTVGARDQPPATGPGAEVAAALRGHRVAPPRPSPRRSSRPSPRCATRWGDDHRRPRAGRPVVRLLGPGRARRRRRPSASATCSAPSCAERRAPGWQVDPGTYTLLVGRSSADLTGWPPSRSPAHPPPSPSRPSGAPAQP